MTAKELKASILDLAIRGKLVPQDPNDEPAEKLLARIAAGKAKLVKSGKLKKEKPLPPITDDDKPFGLPRGWVWCRLGEITPEFTYGTASKSQKVGKVPVLRMGNLQNGEIDYSDLVYTSSEDDIAKYHLEKFDLLFNRTNSADKVGKVSIYRATIPAIYAGYLVRFRPEGVNLEFVNYVMNSAYAYDFCQTVKSDAIGQSNISASKLRNFLLPLPPLAEQKRIVEKIEQLMPLVERYGQAEEKRRQLITALPEALKKSILKSAVEGKLVPQDPNDEPAEKLLARIAAEKAKLVKSGKLKKEKPLPPIAEDEKPFALPHGWAWCRLRDVSISIGGRENQILAKEVKPTGLVPVVSQGASLIDGYSDARDKAIIDIPVVMFGDHTRNVKYVDFAFVIGADGTKFFKPLVDAKWLYYWTRFTAVLIASRGYGRHWGLLNEKPLALPPLAEQKRIVAQIEGLIGIVHRIEK